MGCYIAFNLDFYSFTDLNYCEKDIIKEFKEFSPIVENYWSTKYILPKPNQYYEKLIYPIKEGNEIRGLIRDTIKNDVKGFSVVHPLVEKDHLDILFYSDTLSTDVLDCEVIINNSIFYHQIQPKSYHIWYTQVLFKDVNSLKIKIEDEEVANYNFPEDHKRFFIENYKGLKEYNPHICIDKYN